MTLKQQFSVFCPIFVSHLFNGFLFDLFCSDSFVMSSATSRLSIILSRYLVYCVSNANRKVSTSPQNLVRQRNFPARREIDFLQPTSKISAPFAVCVLKNYFVSFDFVGQPNVGKAIEVVEYHLNGGIKARLILTAEELRVLYESVKSVKNALMEGHGSFSSVETAVDQTTMRIWEDMECGLRVLQISQSTPLYNSLRPLVIPIYNLKEFLNKMDTVLTSEKSHSS